MRERTRATDNPITIIPGRVAHRRALPRRVRQRCDGQSTVVYMYDVRSMCIRFRFMRKEQRW